jgi:beta-N-acetylhexosaminidase
MRAWFGEFVPTGASPVSVPGLGYSLIVQTAPNPGQIIPLIPVTTGEVITDTQATPAPLTLKIGDRLKLRAGPVYDMNGHIVPDGTQVQFILSYPTERVEQREPPVSTRDGVADTTILLERQGQLQIRAEADPALNSYVVVVDTTDQVSSIETIRPTSRPTETPPSTMVPATQTPETIVPLPQASEPPTPLPPRSSLFGFLLALFGLLGVGAGLWAMLTRRWPAAFLPRARLRAALGVWTLGWLAYAVAALGMPGTRWASDGLGLRWAGPTLLALVIAAISAGVVLTLARRRISAARNAAS